MPTLGFTLIELLVSLAVLSVLASLLLPALGIARNRSRATLCLHHLRQLQLCWTMYVEDHQGWFPINQAVFTGGVWRSTADSWSGASHSPLDTTLEPLRQGALWTHHQGLSARLFRCPDDASTVRNSRLPRTRSFSMNGNLGGRTNELQRTILHENEIPEPARLFVFIDEHEDSIDDGHFLVWPSPDDRWVNLPAGRHGNLGLWTAADGHGERRRWLSPKSFSSRRDYWMRAGHPNDLADLRWLQSFTLPFTNRPPRS